MSTTLSNTFRIVVATKLIETILLSWRESILKIDLTKFRTLEDFHSNSQYSISNSQMTYKCCLNRMKSVVKIIINHT